MAAPQKFTNSGLVSFTMLSPHNSGTRTHVIDTITVHTISGNMTAENCARMFAGDTTQASSNYIIGSDGKIAMSVEEKNRSWCSSNGPNDQRAITIEVASLTTVEPFPCSPQAWNSLVDLCVDICERNNIPELRWKADKSLIGQVDKQNMTVHRWFSDKKSCPGDYLYSRMGQLANEVNAKLKLKKATYAASTIATIAFASNEDYIWSYLKGKHFADHVIAAIMGCMQAESGFIPNNLENSAEKRLGLNDEQYTTAVDKGAYPATRFSGDGAGYGLCQWTYGIGKQNLLQFAKDRKKSIGDLYLQCEFFWWDINVNFKKLFNKLTASKSIETALRAFLDTYEYGGTAPDSIYNHRLKYAKEIYSKHVNKKPISTTTTTPKTETKVEAPKTATGRKCPYIARVRVGELNIRKEPTTGSPIVGSIKDKGTYTIIEEATGTGATLWGKLKSGIGWIALDYCGWVKNV